MADSAASPAISEANPQKTDSGAPNSHQNQPDPVHPSAPPAIQPPPSSSAPVGAVNPNSNPSGLPTPPPPPPSISYAAAGAAPQVSCGAVAPPVVPSFRPVAPQAAQFSPIPNPINYQNPAVQPPGVGSASPMTPGVASGAGAVPVPGQMQPMMVPYQIRPGQHANPAMRPFAPMPNGYTAIPGAPQGTMPPPGMLRYPPPYGSLVRPSFPPRPPGAVNVLPVSRPPVAGIPPVRPVIPPVVRPVVAPSITPADKPQTTVYIGKIASTVENEFMLSLLQLCGPIKSWKRPQNPTNGTPLSFGFWEFESAEGVLRALRLLNKLNIDGQELTVNPNDATKEYLEKYVKKKNENLQKDTQAVGSEKDDESAQPSNAKEDGKPDDSKKEDSKSGNKENHNVTNLGIITVEDREADREALEKITNLIEERLKTRPLPPPPAQTAPDGSANSALEQHSKARDGDSDADTVNNEAGDDKNEKETNSENKATSEHDRPETPDNRRHDRRSRERDRDRELKREKDRELERYEREAERERIRKEREQRRRIEEAARQYEACLKDWEYREREKEKERQYEKEKEKERERKRRKETLYDEEDEDEDSRKRWRRSSLDEKRKKRLREKEEDLVDKQKEEEEIAEAKRRAEEDQQLKQQRHALRLFSEQVNGGEKSMATEDMITQAKSIVTEQDTVVDHGYEGHIGDGNPLNCTNDESTIASVAVSDTRQSGNVPAKKLGFGLFGSGKRTTVPSVFHEEEEDDAHKDKKMRPLVPIDYSTEELQAVQPTVSGAPSPNLAAAAEFAKRLSNANIKEEKVDGEWDRSRRSSEKSNYRDRDRNDYDGSYNKDESREKISDRDRDRDRGLEKQKTSDNKKLLDAKQLIDMIPKTKDELFSYEINWAVYDKHQLHERMRPWISKKIREFLGEEETTLVDYIVSSTQEHVKASQMLELLQSILDEEAEMFVLKMWRMLIFEIKRVETGLATRSKS